MTRASTAPSLLASNVPHACGDDPPRLPLALHGLALRLHRIVQRDQAHQQAIPLVLVKLVKLPQCLHGLPADPLHLPVHVPGKPIVDMIRFPGRIPVRAPVETRRESPCIAWHRFILFRQQGTTAPARYRLSTGAEEGVLFGKKLWNRSMSSSGDVSSASSPTR